MLEAVLYPINPESVPLPPKCVKMEPFVPSPKASGFCWSPHGYLVHFRSSHMTEENTKHVELYSKNEIIKFINENKDVKHSRFNNKKNRGTKR